MDDVLKGYAQMQAKINRLMKNLPHEGAAALYTEAQIEATESRRRTPVDRGNLRASHFVMPPVIKRWSGDAFVTIQVGGPAAPYAVFVHENLDAHHKVGQAKFLESTLRESAPYMGERVAARIDLRRASQ